MGVSFVSYQRPPFFCLPSSGREGHLVTPPASLASKIFVGIDLLVAKPSIPVLVPEELHRAGGLMGIRACKIPLVILCCVGHGSLLS